MLSARWISVKFQILYKEKDEIVKQFHQIQCQEREKYQEKKNKNKNKEREKENRKKEMKSLTLIFEPLFMILPCDWTDYPWIRSIATSS